MPRAYPPGTRKGNRRWVVRGWIDGKQHEIATDARNTRAALEAWDIYKSDIRADSKSRGRAIASFRSVAERYKAARRVGKVDAAHLARLCRVYLPDEDTEFGDLPIRAIVPMHVSAAAAIIHPNGKPQSVNRTVYTPAAAVLHFAAENQLRDYLVIRKLKEPDPAPRRPASGIRDILLANTDGYERALLVVLFMQGFRLSEAIALRWERVNLSTETAEVYIPKRQKWKPIPLHAATVIALAGLPGDKRDGPVFPWPSRWHVYPWFKQLRERLGIYVTPHMARHDFAGRLREVGATNRDIVDTGTWTSERSLARYNTAPPEHARSVLSRLETGGKTGGKRARH